MNRRDFNLLSLASLAATTLPEITEAAAPVVQRDPLRPLRTYVAAIGGQHIYVTGRAVSKSTTLAASGNAIGGVIIMAAGVLNCGGQDKLYHLGHAAYNPLTDGDKIRQAYERFTSCWAPAERFYEAGGMLEKMLDLPPYPTRVSEICVATNVEELADDLVPRVVADTHQEWCEVSAVEPHNGNTFRQLFPVRTIHGRLEGERLEVMQAARVLEKIHRRFANERVGTA